MSDYISRQQAINAMKTWDKFGCDPDGKLVRYDDDKHYIPYVHYEDMVHAIKHLPSAQPEIIRCRDCKHRTSYWGNCKLLEEKYHQTVRVGCDEFCSMAERRTDEA